MPAPLSRAPPTRSRRPPATSSGNQPVQLVGQVAVDGAKGALFVERGGPLSRGEERERQVETRGGVIRLHAKRLFVVCDRFAMLRPVGVSQREVEMRLGVIVVEADRVGICGDRCVTPREL